MKKILLAITLVLCIGEIIKAQVVAATDTPFDLLNTPWETTKRNYGIIKSNRNTSISYTDVPGADNDIRIYQRLAFPMPNTFAVKFYFTVNDVSNVGAALLPIVFTAGNQAPSNPDQVPAEQTNQDALGILFQTPLNNKNSLQISPYIKKGATPEVALYNKMIKLEYKKAYTIQLTRCNATKGNITVKLKEELIGSVDFDIPANLNTLTYMQAANMVQASRYRNCSAISSIIYYIPEKYINCNVNEKPADPIKPVDATPVEVKTNAYDIIDHEDIANKLVERLGPGCCQLQSVQYGEHKSGFVTQGTLKFNALAQADCNDVLSINKSIVFPGRRTIVYFDNITTNDAIQIMAMDTLKAGFKIYKNKQLTNTITYITESRYMKCSSEDYTHLVNNQLVPMLTNKYFYNKPLDDFPAYCISYRNGDSTKYLRITYTGKKRNITSFTVWNSETNNTVTYEVIRDKNKYTRFSLSSPMHYFIGLQTPENPNPILNVFGFRGDQINDIVPSSNADGATKVHFDYTFIKNASSHLTSMRGTNGTNIIFNYDCNYDKPVRDITPPPPPKEEPKVTPVDAPKDIIKPPKNPHNPKEMGGQNKPVDIKKPVDTKKPTDIKPPVDTKKPTDVKKPDAKG